MSKSVGLIDCDNYGNLSKCFPNIPLMKLSAWHKSKGDAVEWYDPLKHYDFVYMSKVFSFTKEPFDYINADIVIRGGSGYYIQLCDGREVFDQNKHVDLPYDIEHMYPDYSLYGITSTAYGFMSRGCPRGCFFCHVKAKEGCRSYKVADLSEFWHGQKYIEICDPNTLACPDWKNILQQLVDSSACISFNQGVDIRLMTDEACQMLMKMNLRHIHFAFDRYQDKHIIVPKLERFKELTGWGRSKVSVYILTNYDSTIDQDLERVMICRDLDFNPYIMRYDKEHIARGSEINKLARWVNTKRIFWSCPTFDQYKTDLAKGLWI